MTESRTETAEPRPLEILGVSEAEERTYRWLLTHPRATAPEAARALALTTVKTQRLLDVIEAKGLTTHSPERPRRYIPISPDISLEALALKHQKNLQRAWNTIQELQKQAAAAQPHGEQEQMVELIASREAQCLIIEQITRTARHEIIALIRSPMLISRLNVPSEQDHYSQREAAARGVRFRSIVDAEFLALPNAVRRIREDMEAGEEIRVVSHLPFKMVLTDRRIAFVPLNLQGSDSPSLLVRSSALLEALYALFEILWERATPISFTPAGVLEDGNPGSRFPEGANDMLSLLVAGMNDKGIVYELEISRSTFTRRLAEIMKAMDARTRFQLGYLTALRLSAGSSEQRTTVPDKSTNS